MICETYRIPWLTGTHHINNASMPSLAVHAYRSEQKYRTNPTPRRTHNVLVTITTKCYQAYALRTGGGWSGDLLIADGDDFEKNIASEVPAKRFTSKEIQVTTVHGYYICQCADKSLKEDGYVVDSRPLRERQLRKASDHAEGNSDVDDHPLRHGHEEATQSQIRHCQKHEHLSTAKPKRTRTTSGPFQMITFTVITLHLAVNCMFHESHRSQHLSYTSMYIDKQTPTRTIWRRATWTIILRPATLDLRSHSFAIRLAVRPCPLPPLLLFLQAAAPHPYSPSVRDLSLGMRATCWNVEGQSDWIGFARCQTLEQRPHHAWVKGRLTKDQQTLSPDSRWP